jgi:glycosyltransferase involved in cell wall biosynthesis
MKNYGIQVSLKQKNEPPFFSVIITTYNRAVLLERALHSLLAQTESSWEAIIVDDGSTDDTAIRILPYLNVFPNVQFLKNKIHEEEAPRNAGVKVASGRFITFLDSDDEYYPEHLKSRKQILEQNPSVQFLYGGAKILGNQYVPDRFDPSKKVNLKECVIGGTFFIERQLMLSLKGFRKAPLEADGDLFERVMKTGVQSLRTDLPTYVYHHENADSITNIHFLG